MEGPCDGKQGRIFKGITLFQAPAALAAFKEMQSARGMEHGSASNGMASAWASPGQLTEILMQAELHSTTGNVPSLVHTANRHHKG